MTLGKFEWAWLVVDVGFLSRRTVIIDDTSLPHLWDLGQVVHPKTLLRFLTSGLGQCHAVSVYQKQKPATGFGFGAGICEGLVQLSRSKFVTLALEASLSRPISFYRLGYGFRPLLFQFYKAGR